MYFGEFFVLGLLSDSEFKSAAVPSAAVLRKLAALAAYGNDSFHSVFTAMAERSGLTERGREAREKRREHYAALTRMMMASTARIAEFQRKLDRLEQAAYEDLRKTEEALREARQEEERVKERAFKVRMPDGTSARVYRDGDIVRDDDGNEVSREIIRAEEIGDQYSKWQERAQTREKTRALVERRDRDVEFIDEVKETREQTAGREMPDDGLDDIAARIDEATPPGLRGDYEGREAPKRDGAHDFTIPGSGVSGPGQG